MKLTEKPTVAHVFTIVILCSTSFMRTGYHDTSALDITSWLSWVNFSVPFAPHALRQRRTADTRASVSQQDHW